MRVIEKWEEDNYWVKRWYPANDEPSRIERYTGHTIPLERYILENKIW